MSTVPAVRALDVTRLVPIVPDNSTKLSAVPTPAWNTIDESMNIATNNSKLQANHQTP